MRIATTIVGATRERIATLIFLLAGTTACAQGTVERFNVHGESLEGNLMGEPATPFVSIYLPPSYETDMERRYPVVYALHGFFSTDLSYFEEGAYRSDAGVA